MIRFVFVGAPTASEDTGRISHLGPSELPEKAGFNSHNLTTVHRLRDVLEYGKDVGEYGYTYAFLAKAGDKPDGRILERVDGRENRS